jgi:hypothetical protein
MSSDTNQLGKLGTKLIALLAILACLALGAIGLLLPIIPGLLFLAIAAVIVAKHSPSMDRWLRRNATLGSYLDRADRIHDLPFAKKIQYGSLLCLKMLIDGVAFLVTLTAKLLSFSARRYRQYR